MPTWGIRGWGTWLAVGGLAVLAAIVLLGRRKKKPLTPLARAVPAPEPVYFQRPTARAPILRVAPSDVRAVARRATLSPAPRGLPSLASVLERTNYPFEPWRAVALARTYEMAWPLGTSGRRPVSDVMLWPKIGLPASVRRAAAGDFGPLTPGGVGIPMPWGTSGTGESNDWGVVFAQLVAGESPGAYANWTMELQNARIVAEVPTPPELSVVPDRDRTFVVTTTERPAARGGGPLGYEMAVALLVARGPLVTIHHIYPAVMRLTGVSAVDMGPVLIAFVGAALLAAAPGVVGGAAAGAIISAALSAGSVAAVKAGIGITIDYLQEEVAAGRMSAEDAEEYREYLETLRDGLPS